MELLSFIGVTSRMPAALCIFEAAPPDRKLTLMKTLLASILALGLLATTADAAIVGVHVGPIGIGLGHYHHGGHGYRHRHWEHNHYRYW
jgi:hypothetical protein